ncbi:copper homeostasis protein CutC [Pedococcus sp. 2YAF34]|uniref:copper homeostasis protein CutC n=1 Tax=Pedococcus sp. 2YAF34 TaxID=3233032 RepID=UPI003F9E12B8
MTMVEICVDDVAGARTAEACGADRVELCADLLEGGITPSIGMVGTTLASVRRVGVQVLIRPRGGCFTYDADEVAAMLADIAAVRRLPTAVRVGFVVNALTPDRRVDEDVTRELVTACGGSPVTFSRAFDEVPDQYAALDVLARLGVHRILTAGGPGPAADHHDSLRDLVRHARNRLTVLAAGGVRSGNVAALVERTGVSEVHLRAPASSPTPHGTQPYGTSADEVRAVLAAVGRMDP